MGNIELTAAANRLKTFHCFLFSFVSRWPHAGSDSQSLSWRIGVVTCLLKTWFLLNQLQRESAENKQKLHERITHHTHKRLYSTCGSFNTLQQWFCWQRNRNIPISDSDFVLSCLKKPEVKQRETPSRWKLFNRFISTFWGLFWHTYDSPQDTYSHHHLRYINYISVFEQYYKCVCKTKALKSTIKYFSLAIKTYPNPNSDSRFKIFDAWVKCK